MVQTITTRAPRVEGGIAVAPKTFGRYCGDLIAPDEISGRVFAIAPRGTSALVVNSGLPSGPDTGVESEVFLPTSGRFDALLADRLTPGNPHPGDDVLLHVRSAALFAAGAQPGDLLVATEGGRPYHRRQVRPEELPGPSCRRRPVDRPPGGPHRSDPALASSATVGSPTDLDVKA